MLPSALKAAVERYLRRAASGAGAAHAFWGCALRAAPRTMAPSHRAPVIEPLNLQEAYATASLFMLSLRETLWEACADVPSQRGLWGAHGLCRAVCAQLDVPERAWEVRTRGAGACTPRGPARLLGGLYLYSAFRPKGFMTQPLC